jgi:hypothetical protein
MTLYIVGLIVALNINEPQLNVEIGLIVTLTIYIYITVPSIMTLNISDHQHNFT